MYPYLPILILAGVALGCACIGLFLSWWLAPSRPSATKIAPYECGFDAFAPAQRPFDIRFYLVAILFIIFDLEIILLFPWAVQVKKIGGLGFLSVILFLGILAFGFIYEWKKGALEWD